MKIKLNKKYYSNDSTKGMYKKLNINLIPGITTLIGCNGAGKSTILKQIESTCKDKAIPHLYFNGIVNDEISYNLSYGENTNLLLVKFIDKLYNFINRYKNTDKVVILLDSIDCGLSIDNILELKQILNILLQDIGTTEAYIVCSCNTYEMCLDTNKFSVYDGNYIVIETYKDFREYVIKSRLKKEKRYNKEVNKLEAFFKSCLN